MFTVWFIKRVHFFFDSPGIFEAQYFENYFNVKLSYFLGYSIITRRFMRMTKMPLLPIRKLQEVSWLMFYGIWKTF